MKLFEETQMLIYVFNLALIIAEIIFFIKLNRLLKLNFFIKTILFFIIYLIQTISLIMVMHFKSGKYLLYMLFSTVDKTVVIQDPQDYLKVLWEMSIINSTFIFFILSTFYFHFLFSGVLRKEEYQIYKYIIILVYYTIFISGLIFMWDLLFYHWEIFYSEKMFDFQPDLLTWFMYYKEEYQDILSILIFLSLTYTVFFFQSNNYLDLIKNNVFWRFIPVLIFSLYSLYIFGGESLTRDLWLISLSFISGEFMIFSKICFETFKRLKTSP